MGYIFYDTETTGLETEFDQILQFAAIRTDDDFNELEHFDIKCQLLPHIVPGPGGLLKTRIPIATLADKNLPTHYDAIKQIYKKLLGWSPAIFVGYNSISYDEELMRNIFFQTLHPTYLTNTNGNTRADIMRFAYAVSVYAPESIIIPLNAKGNPSFKLDELAPANGYLHENAHEALADVRMTIQMAKHIKDKAPKIWEEMMGSIKKTNVFRRLTQEPEFSLTERYGKNVSHYLVTLCCISGTSDAVVFDLEYDPGDYLSLSVNELIKLINNKTKKPIRALNANKQPILMPSSLAPAETKSLSISSEERARRVEIIRSNIDFQKRVEEAFGRRYEDKEAPEHLEQALYSNGFVEKDDEALIQKFQVTDWTQRIELVNQIKDERIREFAQRLIFLEKPELLSSVDREKMQKWVTYRLFTTEDVPWTTVPKAIAEIDKYLIDADEDDLKYLTEIKEFILGRNPIF